MRNFQIPPGQEPSRRLRSGQEPFPGEKVPSLAELREADMRSARKLKALGMAFFFVGAALSAVGAVSIYSHYYITVIDNLETIGSDPRGMLPPYAWCLYVGLPLLVISWVLRITAWTRRVRPLRSGRAR